ncbi:MAG: cytidine deaminase [Cyclobacteriaceae bacterium]
MNSLTIPYEISTFEALSREDQDLINEARTAMLNAHAPYSNFLVGSSVKDENDKITTGNNQENAAYPSGLCAERVALFAAKSQSKAALKTIVVLAQNEKNELADAFPCGSCRQVMLEYASLQETPIRVLMQKKEGDYIVIGDVKQLLPFQFDADQLS